MKDKIVEFLEENDWDWEEYEGYSGRGMFGRKSEFAFRSSEPPRTKFAERFLGEFEEVRVDNLGLDYIYYLG